MKRALMPGSFDPITNGHLDIIQRASQLFDEVLVGVAENTGKNGLFTLDERKEMATSALADLTDVQVVTISGLTAAFAKEHAIDALVRGLRNTQDFTYEQPIAVMNNHLTDVETMFLLARPENVMISSSLLKEVVRAKGDISAFVPRIVNQRLKNKFEV